MVLGLFLLAAIALALIFWRSPKPAPPPATTAAPPTEPIAQELLSLVRAVGGGAPAPEQMTVRRLDGGDIYRVREVARLGRQIEIELLEDAPGIAVGALVEISTRENMLLGQLLGRQGPRLRILLEHAVDRAKVAAIQELWEQT